MAKKLTIFQNSLDAEPEEQFKQINLALDSLNTWSKGINNSIALKVVSDELVTTSATQLSIIPNYDTIVNISSVLARIDLSLNLTCPAEATIVILFDGQSIRQVSDAVNAKHLVYITDTISTFPGKHTLQVQWKTASGTLTKNANGGSALIVTNLI